MEFCELEELKLTVCTCVYMSVPISIVRPDIKQLSTITTFFSLFLQSSEVFTALIP